MKALLFLVLLCGVAWAKDATYIRQPDNGIWRVEMYHASEERDLRAQLIGEIEEIDKTVATLQESPGTDITVTALLNRRLKLVEERAYLNSPDVSSTTVKITSPLNNAVVSGQVNITADAYDDFDLPVVQFKVDGSNVGPPLPDFPYTFRLNTIALINGPHTLTATGQDFVGNITTSLGVNINVSN